MNELQIRLEEEKDYFHVETLVRDSFYNVYRPGCMEHYLLHELRSHKDFVKELDFVLEKNNIIIGQNVFVKNVIDLDDGSKLDVLTMGPISIANNYQKKSYGKYFLSYCLEKAKELGYGAVLIEGNYDFYSKVGFEYASKYHIRYKDLPDGMEADFFLCYLLKDGYLDNISGEYGTSEAYLVDEAKVEEFDKKFPYKEKKVLDSQIFK